MLEKLIQVLQEQQISQEKITFIMNQVSNLETTDPNSAIWHTFCQSCLEMNIDPQTVFALAVSKDSKIETDEV